MPRKIIIDTDPGVDDVLAIILALASPEIDLRLISIVFGNTHAPVAYGNLLKIYALLGREISAFPSALGRFPGLTKTPRVKLALGENGPIAGEKAVAAYFVRPPLKTPYSLERYLPSRPIRPLPMGGAAEMVDQKLISSTD